MKEEKKNEIIFQTPRLKMFLYFLICSGFVLIGAFILKYEADFYTKLIGGYLNIFFFGIGSLTFLYKLIFARPILIISSKGIYTNWFFFKELRKWIPWNEIERIGKNKQNIETKGARINQEYLVIYLKNPEKFDFNYETSDSKNILKKIIGTSIGYFKSNNGLKGDLYIPPSILANSLEEGLLILEKYPVKIDRNIERINA